MAEELYVEAMLEAPYKREDDYSRNGESLTKSRDKDRRRRSRSREKGSSRSRSTRRSPTRSKGKDQIRERRDHKADRERRRSRSRDKKRSKSQEKIKVRRQSRSRSRSKERPFILGKSRDRFHRHSVSPLRLSGSDCTPEERDARTVVCMQLSARIRPKDMEEFFSSVGKVRDVRLITDNKTRRSKGIAYVEFGNSDSVPLAMGLTGQKLLGVPILVSASQAEKNRLAMAGNASTAKGMSGPMRLYVGSLHFNITEDMLQGIFEPFGKIDHINLVNDNETGRSKGFGFVTFHNAEDAKKALDQLNGFELAGRPMKVGHVTERQVDAAGGSTVLDTDEMDRAGVELGATGRLQLMAKLAEGTGFEIPQAAANALSGGAPAAGTPFGGVPGVGGTDMGAAEAPATMQSAPPIATQCFMLSNMFDPNTETVLNWETEIRDDVIEECNKHGGVLHIYVDKASPQGNVYVKCPSIAAAVASVNALHGRYFAGKVITAAYVPLPNYHQLFPESHRAVQLVMPSTQALNARHGLSQTMASQVPFSL